MKGKRKFQEIEMKYGKPMRDVLMELYEKHSCQTLVARELGVSSFTVSVWLLKVGLEARTILVPRRFPADPAEDETKGRSA